MLRLPPIATGLLLATLPALADAAQPFGPGERIRWSVSYMKVRAGEAWAEVSAGAGGELLISGGARNADWYGRIYTIDDRVDSRWDPLGPGSREYRTRFREGGFHQDQLMRIRPRHCTGCACCPSRMARATASRSSPAGRHGS
jgi:hypothetical protein